MRWSGRPLTSAGIAAGYKGLLDGLVADDRTAAVPILETSVLMNTTASRRAVAQRTLEFALALT
jgi:hypothetical protein